MGSYYAPEHLGKFGTIAQGNPDLAEKFFATPRATDKGIPDAG